MTTRVQGEARFPLPASRFPSIELYKPERAAEVDLSDNTNRWGMPPAARRALIEGDLDQLSRYPDAYGESLKTALAVYAEADPAMIVTGCGSDDVLDCAIRAFCGTGDRVAFQDPSFPMVLHFARTNDAQPVPVPLQEDYEPDVEAMLAADARVVYLCSPNNPTGTPVSRRRIEEIVSRARGVVIVDEAYAEFAESNVLDLAREATNVLVVRTMSKAFGLAGLRVGYGVGDAALIREIEKSRGPYKVNAAASRAAVAALTDDLAWVREHATQAKTNRERLTTELRERSIDVLPSSANFVLAPITNAIALARRMRELGVGVRAFGRLPGISEALRRTDGSALRITVGPWEQVEAALAALDDARATCA